MTHTYAPGAGYAVATGDFLVFLPQGAKPQVLRDLWKIRERPQNTGFLDILTAVTSSLDPSLENLPCFVVVEMGPAGNGSQEARIAVSGSAVVSLKLAHDDERVEFRGSDAAMWLEERVLDATDFTVFCDRLGEVDFEPSALGLPLAQGIVHASQAWWSFDAAEAAPALVQSQDFPLSSSAEQGLVQVTDDDFGRTLAQLPESWDEDLVSNLADEVYEDSVSPEHLRHFQAGFTSSAPEAPELDDAAPVELVSPHLAFAGGAGRTASAFGGPVPATGPVQGVSSFGAGAGFVRFSHGEVVELGAPIVVGRKPSHEGSGSSEFARMISVPSPSKDISRNHVEIRVEQGHVLVTDLGSVNGTVLRREGVEDRQLAARESTLVINDDVVDLGDGVTLTFEHLR